MSVTGTVTPFNTNIWSRGEEGIFNCATSKKKKTNRSFKCFDYLFYRRTNRPVSQIHKQAETSYSKAGNNSTVEPQLLSVLWFFAKPSCHFCSDVHHVPLCRARPVENGDLRNLVRPSLGGNLLGGAEQISAVLLALLCSSAAIPGE